MYLNEKELFEFLKNNVRSLKNMMSTDSDSGCVRDATTDRFLIELKSRRGDWKYPDSFIEKKKFNNNIGKGKDFLYVVYDQADNKVYIWNITVLLENGYNFKWGVRNCKNTTDFEDTEYVPKKGDKVEF